MKTLAIVLISICYLANTLSVYNADTGGYNVFFGNFGYYIASEGTN